MKQKRQITPYVIQWLLVIEWFTVRNDSATYINDVFITAENISFRIFAFLSDLAIMVIVTVFKLPSLQKPRNTLLCSLDPNDCTVYYFS